MEPGHASRPGEGEVCVLCRKGVWQGLCKDVRFELARFGERKSETSDRHRMTGSGCMAKELSMVERYEQGKRARRYFINGEE